jgi:ATP-dependent Clp protease protease subunit
MYTSALDRARIVAEKFRTASGWQPGTLVARGTGQKATEASLYIYQPIGSDMWTGEGITADSVRKALDAAKGVSTLHVHINSEGGAVFEAFGIYTLLRNLSAKKVVHVDGLAASAASFIAMAGAGEGNEIVTSPVAKWMVHEAWTIAAGRASEMRATAERLEMMNETLAQAYAEQTGKTVEQCLAIMNAETWMTAQQALDLGFTDSIAEFDEEPANDAKGAAVFKPAAVIDATHQMLAATEAEVIAFRARRAGAHVPLASPIKNTPASPGKRAQAASR